MTKVPVQVTFKFAVTLWDHFSHQKGRRFNERFKLHTLSSSRTKDCSSKSLAVMVEAIFSLFKPTSVSATMLVKQFRSQVLRFGEAETHIRQVKVRVGKWYGEKNELCRKYRLEKIRKKRKTQYYSKRNWTELRLWS